MSTDWYPLHEAGWELAAVCFCGSQRPLDCCQHVVRVRLTRKLADCIDDVSLTDTCVGDVLDLPAAQAQLLVAEEWATATERRQIRRRLRGVERRVKRSRSLT